MTRKSIMVEVLESNADAVKVKLPFLSVPVEMNYAFFQRRIQSGYFKLQRESFDYIIDKA